MAEKKAKTTAPKGDAKKDAKKAGGGGDAKKAAATKSTTAAATTGKKEKSLGELTAALAERTGLTKVKVKEFLDAHAALLVEELRHNGSVQLAGVGKLKMGERPERQGRNPATGAAITIKAAKTVKFSGGKSFKDQFNG